MEYDNRYNGALFATRDPSTLAGPFTLSDEPDEPRLRVVCNLAEAGGSHTIAVYAERADGKGLKKKPLARGTVRRNSSRNEAAPIARGYLANRDRRVPIVLWHVTGHDGVPCYQIKPDRISNETPTDLPSL